MTSLFNNKCERQGDGFFEAPFFDMPDVTFILISDELAF